MDKNEIYKIYTTYGENEKKIMNRVVIDVISDTSTLYSSDDFFTKRSLIQNKMKEDLQRQIKAKTYHEVEFFQLRSLNLPDSFENEIQNTEVKGQDIYTANKELERDRVLFATSVDVATKAVNSTISTAYGEANQTIYAAIAESSTIKDVIMAQAGAYKTMKQTFANKSMTFTEENIVQYLQNSLIKDYDKSKVSIAIDL